MSDNELDKLFKEAAEGFKPPQDASAWEQMASMLDKKPVGTAGFRNWKTISGITITGLITVTAVWFASINVQNKISKTNEKNGSNNATQGVVQEQKEQPHPAGTENLPSAQSVEGKVSGTHVVTETQTVAEVNARARGNAGTIKQMRSSSNTHKESGGDSFIRSNREVQDASENPEPAGVVAEQKMSGSVQAESEGADVSSNTISNKVLSENEISGDPVLIQADSANKRVAEPKAESVAEESKSDRKEKSKTGSRLSIKAAFSPDFSSVNYFSAGKTGTNFGLLVGYSFNNRWSVYTGVISSRKRYDTKDVEGSYNWNDHDYPMKELDGDCRILDIPINVYYSFFPEKSFSLRAGLGFSSYIMRKETYIYCVDNYGSNAYYEQNVEGENNEWFRVMNLSLAISKKLSNRLSAEFEPFVKAPLTGVGEGKVSLVSMGAFINLKYDFIIFK